MSNILQKFVESFPIALTEKESIKRAVYNVIKNICKPDSCCVDIGSYRGHVLKMMIEQSPNGTHFAYEPLPKMFNQLVRKYASAAHIKKIALSNEVGTSVFYHTQENPAYSGLKKRKYPRRFHLEKLEVQVETLDHVLNNATPISLINIDVKGAEFLIIKGAIETIKKHRPIVTFQFDANGAEAYGVSAEMVFDYFTKQLEYNLYTLIGFSKGKKHISRIDFVRFFNDDSEHYYAAAPKISTKKIRNIENLD